MNMETPIAGLSMRQPPANQQAEQALLGAILANNRAYERVSAFLKPEHFADPVHAAIYGAIEETILKGGLADGVTMVQRFKNTGELDDAGGTAYIAQLLTAMVGILNAGEYGRAIYDAWKRRKLIEAGEAMVNGGFAGDMDPAEVAARTLNAIDQALENRGDERAAISFDDAMDAALSMADEAATKGGTMGMSTGMPRVDRQLRGMQDGQLIVLAGRPGMGKTSLAAKWTLNVARAVREENQTAAPADRGGVLCISLEESAEGLATKLICIEAGVPTEKVQLGEHAAYANQLIAARRRLHGMPLIIEDVPGQTVKMLDAKVRSAQRRLGRLRLIMVDHLQIVRADEKDTRNGGAWAVGQASNAMKRIAKQYRCPVLLLSQLSRDVEKREDKRPQLADLRWSGDIEQDADAVLFIYREEYYLRQAGEPAQERGEGPGQFVARKLEYEERLQQVAGNADLIAAKVRGGKTGTIKLKFKGETTDFTERDEGELERQWRSAGD